MDKSKQISLIMDSFKADRSALQRLYDVRAKAAAEARERLDLMEAKFAALENCIAAEPENEEIADVFHEMKGLESELAALKCEVYEIEKTVHDLSEASDDDVRRFWIEELRVFHDKERAIEATHSDKKEQMETELDKEFKAVEGV